MDEITSCERCGRERKSGYRYCGPCAKAIKAEMRRSGYLQKLPKPTKLPEETEENEEIDLEDSVYPTAIRLLEDER